MPITLGLLLTLSFIVSLLALSFLIWAIANRQVTMDQGSATTIFAPGEEGRIDNKGTETDDGNEHVFDPAKSGIDAISATPVIWMLAAAIFWLLLGSGLGVVASLKLHLPDWLNGQAELTFGRIRTLHLNMVAYGWVSQAGLACVFWIIPRIFRTQLRLPRLTYVGLVLWNAALLGGMVAVSQGWTDGEEWLEIPWQFDIGLAVAGIFFAIPLVVTTRAREVHHIYVTGWYFLAALVWFPVIFIVANLPYIHRGVEEATVNWWFAHNVLGLWITPLAVGTAYYFIPKIIGRPIYSYAVSLLGFWGLALFYSQVGIHHLIGGPVPTWLVTLSVVHSVMMFVPVIAVAVNHHITVSRNLWALRESVPLRFVWFGALMYTAASFQGANQALRSVNSVVHFTHYTVGHAHLGVYAFASIVFFGAAYHLLPYATGRSFRWPGLINAHFWSVVIGFAIYFGALTVGGIRQGLAMLDATRPFADSVILMMPYLEMRSLGGSLMTLGHVLFAINFISILMPRRTTATEGEVAA